MSLELARLDCMRQFECGRHLSLRRIGRVLIKFELFDRDRERRCLRFIGEALHQDVVWEKFLVEDDAELLIGRSVFGWLENENVAARPMPGSADFWFQSHALQRWFVQVFQPRSRFAEVKNKPGKLQVFLQLCDFNRLDANSHAARFRLMFVPVQGPGQSAREQKDADNRRGDQAWVPVVKAGPSIAGSSDPPGRAPGDVAENLAWNSTANRSAVRDGFSQLREKGGHFHRCEYPSRAKIFQ